jgi:hypothetical protein
VINTEEKIPVLKVLISIGHPETARGRRAHIQLLPTTTEFHEGYHQKHSNPLNIRLLMPRYLAQPFNVIKWQLKFNPAA